MKKHFSNIFLILSNHSQPPRDLWKGTTVHDKTCPFVHWHRWSLCYELWLDERQEFNVYYLVTCTVNVLRQLRVNATNWRNLLFKVILQLNAKKNHSFPDIRSYELFLCFDVNSFLKSVKAFRYTLYILSRKTNPERPHPSKDDAIQRDSQGWFGCNVEMGLRDWFIKFLRKNPEWRQVVE